MTTLHTWFFDGQLKTKLSDEVYCIPGVIWNAIASLLTQLATGSYIPSDIG